jgi:preprotein translocase subunit SecG
LEGLVFFVHILVCVLLVIIVLLQSGKSADLAGAFGGGGSQSTFGPRGAASFLSKMTTTLAILFMVTSLTLWIMAANKAGPKSVIQPEDVKQEQTETTPSTTPEDKTDKDKAGQKEGATQPPAESSDTQGKTKETPKKEEPGKTGSEKQPGNS